MAAVQTTDEGHPEQLKLSGVKGFRKDEIVAWAKHHLQKDTAVVSDGWTCFDGVRKAGCQHQVRISEGRRAAVQKPEFYWVNTVLGHLKSALRSSYHWFEPKYAQRYLARKLQAVAVNFIEITS